MDHSYASQPANLAPKQETISSLLDSMFGKLDHLSGLASNLESIADRIHGPTPQEVSAESSKPCGDIQSRLAYISRVLSAHIDRIDAAGARIGRSIG